MRSRILGLGIATVLAACSLAPGRAAVPQSRPRRPLRAPRPRQHRRHSPSRLRRACHRCRCLAPPARPTLAQVVDVVDGDTIKVRIDGTVYTVRYIGMDTPETVKPNTPVQWMGPEASAANTTLVAGSAGRPREGRLGGRPIRPPAPQRLARPPGWLAAGQRRAGAARIRQCLDIPSGCRVRERPARCAAGGPRRRSGPLESHAATVRDRCVRRL